MNEAQHTPVLIDEVLGALKVKPTETVVDATLGGAGHFELLLQKLRQGGVIVGIDADPEAVERAREVYARDRRSDRPTAHLVNDNFRNLARILERLNLGSVDAILFDLGWSGFQISAPRGFSFERDEPLLMNYGSGTETAADIVNTLSEKELADMIYTHGEERFARGIARAIVDARKKERILTTGSLVNIIEAAVPEWYRARRIHPATKTFQALRIATNDEKGALQEGLEAALRALSPGGRLAVISFHSGEDRIVKTILRKGVDEFGGTLIHKKPIVPTRTEVEANPRARSAKLRVFERSNTKREGKPTRSFSTVFSYV